MPPLPQAVVDPDTFFFQRAWAGTKGHYEGEEWVGLRGDGWCPHVRRGCVSGRGKTRFTP